ncbi:hypothetical protein D3C78_1823570 [compost metagenome]
MAWRLAHTPRSASAAEMAQAMLDGQLFFNGKALEAPTGSGAVIDRIYQRLVRAYPAQNAWLGALKA